MRKDRVIGGQKAGYEERQSNRRTEGRETGGKVTGEQERG